MRRFVVAAGLAALLLAIAPLAQARSTVNLSLTVSFFTNGTITVAMPDGTPVGTPTGTPTQIPAGYYAVNLIGPGGCTTLPHFVLKGPGESINDNMTEGEVTSFTYNAYFLPSSTYTWTDTAAPSVVYTFTTTADVEGSPPPAPGSAGLQSGNHGTASSTDVVGSGTLQLQGKLAAAVSAAGAVTLTSHGKAVSSLKAGKYTVTVVDRSKTGGFEFVKGNQKLSLTGTAFTGKQTKTVGLTKGYWVFTAGARGNKTYAILVK
jgi:hypothetical protein